MYVFSFLAVFFAIHGTHHLLLFFYKNTNQKVKKERLNTALLRFYKLRSKIYISSKFITF